MKKAIKKIILLAALVLAITSVAMANHYLPAITLKNIPAEKKFSLSIEGLNESENVAIVLTDINGQVLLREEAKGGKQFAKIFNLNQLPAGEYFISIRTSLQETVQPISLTQAEVLVDTGKRKEFFSPVIKVANSDHVDVSLFNGRLADVKVNILDYQNRPVFQEKLENVLLVQKRYRLDKLPWGQYTIEVVTPTHTYSKSFNIR